MSKETKARKFPVKIQINPRTIVIVKTQAALKMWMDRHPEAKILET